MRSLVSSVLKLMCVCLMLLILYHLPFSAVTKHLKGAMGEVHHSGLWIFYRLAAIAVLMLVALKSDKIASWIVPVEIRMESVTSRELKGTLVRVGLLTIGMYLTISQLHLLIVSVVAQMFSATETVVFAHAWREANDAQGFYNFWFFYLSDISGHAAMLIVGLLLCFLSAPLSRAVCWLFMRETCSQADGEA